jgi:hypothetical protein
MLSAMKILRNSFAKPADQGKKPLILRENISEREASLTSLREFRRKRVMSKPIPSRCTSVFD